MPAMLLFASLSGVTTMSYADSVNPNAPVSMIDKWDKTFAESQKVDHRKVSFQNRYGITLVGDLLSPQRSWRSQAGGDCRQRAFWRGEGAIQRPVCANAGGTGICYPGVRPFLYGESGGYPRNVASPDINTEDFSAAVDFLGLQKRWIATVLGCSAFAAGAAWR